MSIDVIIEAPEWEGEGLEALAARAEAATLRHLGLDPAAYETALLGCDDSRIAALNGDFRDKPAPTNVLSWPAEERAPDTPGARPEPPEPGELGDIALAWETCAREAAAAGRPVADHVTHLIVHGMLHLMGFDHETGPDAAVMEDLEVEILASLGLPDPY
ncbi:rRNA maturation RNase YbeY [Psychromarinibacter sp. C21-152]|uniref:Endoribonuclease YbeY n=1 Tax=Psychromarinibacter sediminicola TaxID=3033385 RepID=A0AAE3NRA1_9RHOB|nr:rRNA maturation RNase YbeY [Psychromarinibacter sediminicola]MDF0602823.1 rRNA maturation RNase YbeY [Psychromarinibacter sediminicola]